MNIKDFKNIFSKDKLPRFKVSKEAIIEKLTKTGKKIKKVLTDIFVWLRKSGRSIFNAIVNFTKKINMKNIKAIFVAIKAGATKDNLKEKFSKIKKAFSKENIKDTLRKIKTGFTKENLKKKFEALKAHVKENLRAYIIFGPISVLVVVGFVLSFKPVYYKVVPVSKRYVITANKAEEYFYNREYDKAIEEYLSIKDKDTNKGEGLWDAKISEVYSVKGDIENSKKYADNAIQLGSKNPEVLNSVVFTEYMNKDYKEALKLGEEALSKFPDDKKLIKTMFTVYMANNDKDNAKKLLTNYPLDDKSSVDTAEYADMLMLDGQWDLGYKQLRNAWNIDKDEYKIYDILAQLSVYNKDTLLENVTALSEKNPDDLAYKMWLAKIYSLSDATSDQAEKLINDLKSQNVGKIEIKLIESSALQGLKQNDKADEIIKTVIDENKNDYRILHTASWYYLNKKDLIDAEKYCRESIIKNKNYTDNYGFLMPEILKAEGKSAEGEPYFRTAMFMEPYNYNIMLNIANFYWYTTKNTDKAMEYFNYAQMVNPDEPEIKYNMAQIDISNSKIDDAVSLLQQCIKLSDSTAKYHRTLGTIYLLNGKKADGIKEIRYAYAADQEDILTLNNAGCYYISEDQNLEKGEYNLRKAMEGINSNTDKYTADTIKDNYKKAKQILDQYKTGKSNQTIKVPDLVLFY